MIIRIESIKNGWTERRIELEDDQRLVQTLLRAVAGKRDGMRGTAVHGRRRAGGQSPVMPKPGTAGT